jgi:hypothetical protein
MYKNRKWLKALGFVLLVGATTFGPFASLIAIEELMYIMNQTRIEFTLSDEDYRGDDEKPGSQHPG